MGLLGSEHNRERQSGQSACWGVNIIMKGLWAVSLLGNQHNRERPSGHLDIDEISGGRRGGRGIVKNFSLA